MRRLASDSHARKWDTLNIGRMMHHRTGRASLIALSCILKTKKEAMGKKDRENEEEFGE
jgi:hypothetical protein